MDETIEEYFDRIYGIKPQPPLTHEQLVMLEMGFPVEPNYDPRSRSTKEFQEHVTEIIENTKLKKHYDTH